MKWVKIFANNLSDKWLISDIYEELMQPNSKKPNNPIKKMSKGPEQTFCKRRHANDSQIF